MQNYGLFFWGEGTQGTLLNKNTYWHQHTGHLSKLRFLYKRLGMLNKSFFALVLSAIMQQVTHQISLLNANTIPLQ